MHHFVPSPGNLQRTSCRPQLQGQNLRSCLKHTRYDVWGNLAERDDYPTGSGSPTVTRYAVDGWNPALAGTTGNSKYNVWADLSSSNSLLTRYLHGDQVDQLFARQDAGVQYWYLTDYQSRCATCSTTAAT